MSSHLELTLGLVAGGLFLWIVVSVIPSPPLPSDPTRSKSDTLMASDTLLARVAQQQPTDSLVVVREKIQAMDTLAALADSAGIAKYDPSPEDTLSLSQRRISELRERIEGESELPGPSSDPVNRLLQVVQKQQEQLRKQREYVRELRELYVSRLPRRDTVFIVTNRPAQYVTDSIPGVEARPANSNGNRTSGTQSKQASPPQAPPPAAEMSLFEGVLSVHERKVIIGALTYLAMIIGILGGRVYALTLQIGGQSVLPPDWLRKILFRGYTVRALVVSPIVFGTTLYPILGKIGLDFTMVVMAFESGFFCLAIFEGHAQHKYGTVNPAGPDPAQTDDQQPPSGDKGNGSP